MEREWGADGKEMTDTKRIFKTSNDAGKLKMDWRRRKKREVSRAEHGNVRGRKYFREKKMEKDKRSPNTTRMTHTIPTKTKREDVLLLKSSTASSHQPLILSRSLLRLFFLLFLVLLALYLSRLSHRQVI